MNKNIKKVAAVWRAKGKDRHYEILNFITKNPSLTQVEVGKLFNISDRMIRRILSGSKVEPAS